MRIILLVILCVSSFGGIVFAESAPEVEILRQELTESREVQTQLREEAERLGADNAALQKELLELRKRYADILLASDELSGKLVATDLAAAQLLRKENDVDLEKSEGARMLEILGYCRGRLQEMGDEMEKHRETVLAALEASQASSAIRQQTEKSLDGVEQRLELCLKPMELATDKTLATTAGSCAILKLDAPTQVVILDQGTLHGLKLGDEFTFQRDNEIAATIKIIAVRPAFAAAILTGGEFNALVYGALLHKK